MCTGHGRHQRFRFYLGEGPGGGARGRPRSRKLKEACTRDRKTTVTTDVTHTDLVERVHERLFERLFPPYYAVPAHE